MPENGFFRNRFVTLPAGGLPCPWQGRCGASGHRAWSGFFGSGSLFDRRGACLADDLVLRTRPARTSDRADQLAGLDQRYPAPGRDDAIERKEVVLVVL